jgi:predicted permease
MWRRYLRFWGPDIDADVRDELDFHIEMRTEELIEAGWAPCDARQEALRCFGNVSSVRDACLDIDKRRENKRRGLAFLNDLSQDMSYAVRVLLKKPGLTAVIVLSLALGIGANTAIFTVVKAVLLNRLPVENPEELVLLNWEVGQSKPRPRFMINGWYRKTDSGRRTSSSFSHATFRRIHENSDVFSTAFAFAQLYRLNVNLIGEAELADGLVVSGRYFSGLGVRPQLGRLITAEDDREDSDPVVVLSNRFWRARCGSDPAVVGRTVRLNGNPFVIVGVAPEGFNGTLQIGSSPSFYVPLALQNRVMPREDFLDETKAWWLHIMGRLKPGVDMAAAESTLPPAFLHGIQEDLGTGEEELEWPQLALMPGGQGLTEVRERLIEPLSTAQAVIALILLIACANVATLLLARSEARKREMAVRLSLGASRSRLTRQLLTESVLLALMGGALGLLFGFWGSRSLLMLLPFSGDSPSSLNLNPDLVVLGFTFTVSVLTGLVFGLVPAFRTSGVTPGPSLKDSGLRTDDRSRLGVARMLVVAQVALSLVLLIAAGLLLRSLRNVEAVDPGFNADGLLAFKLDPTLNGYQDESLTGLYDQILGSLKALPDVTDVSMMPHLPISGRGMWDDAVLPEGKKVSAYYSIVDSSFLETMKIPLLFGRSLTREDDTDSPKVALVNEAFAREAFGGENPLGRRFKSGDRDGRPVLEIVGVFRDGKDVSLKEDTQATVMLPFRQHSDDIRSMTFLIRSRQSPRAIVGLARDAIGQIDPNLPLYEVKTMKDQINESMAQERQFSRLTILCGALALLLTCIGLYGTLSANVSRRTQEIGLRMALGARRADITRSIMREMFFVFMGIGIGLAGAWAVTRWLSSMLFQLSALDPITLIGATFLMILVAAAAAFAPARRASRVDPMEALRFE